MPKVAPPPKITEIVERIDSLTDQERVSVRNVVDAFGSSGFLPIMIVPALLVISPLSGIPLFSSFCGIVIALIAAQLLIGRQRIWLPETVLKREISGSRLHEGAERLSWLTRKIDRFTGDRLKFVVGPGRNWIVFLACFLCGAAMPFLEVVPFSSSVLGLATLFLVAGVLSRDGLLVLLGLTIMAAAASIPYSIYWRLT